jgi:exopolyphosphatase / guanosine-5'-triphosphate,3'-diphosphate pyrophosphatase
VTGDRLRVAVVDIGTNSTRLLVADVGRDGALVELERRARVTRLGDRLEETGVLDQGAMERVLATLAEYRTLIEAHRAQRAVAVLTSAVRDAANGEGFLARVRAQDEALEARVIAGDEEARLTFRGATSERAPDAAGPTLVIDVGGGSTELVVGSGDEVSFHVSTQAGVVRHTERHLGSDPPTQPELGALAADVRSIFEQAVPAQARETARTAIAVAGTAMTLGAIDLNLECDRAANAHGHVVPLTACRRILERLAALPESQRRAVRGLHPDRAPTIVAGVVMVIEALEVFGLDATAVSDHDVLRGAALEVVHRAGPRGAAAPGRGAPSAPTQR